MRKTALFPHEKSSHLPTPIPADLTGHFANPSQEWASLCHIDQEWGQGDRTQGREEVKEWSQYNQVCWFHGETSNTDYQQSQVSAAQHKARHRQGNCATTEEPGASWPCKCQVHIKHIARRNSSRCSTGSSWDPTTHFQPQIAEIMCHRGYQCCKGHWLGARQPVPAHKWQSACAKHVLKQYRKSSWKGPSWYMSILFTWKWFLKI